MEPNNLDKWIKNDRARFAQQKRSINDSLSGKTGILDHVDEDTKEDVFYMLIFCLLVPQSKQVLAEKAADGLRDHKFYQKPMSMEDLAAYLKGKARFHNTKAKRLLAARKTFLKGNFWEGLKSKYLSYQSASNEKSRNRILVHTRSWLDSKIDGMGLKLASHFMRNVGMRGLAILDSHVRQAIKDRMGIGNPGDQLKRDEYYILETKVKEYADRVGITLDELDLLFCGHGK